MDAFPLFQKEQHGVGLSTISYMSQQKRLPFIQILDLSSKQLA